MARYIGRQRCMLCMSIASYFVLQYSNSGGNSPSMQCKPSGFFGVFVLNLATTQIALVLS